MVVKTFRGLLADDGQDRIRLQTIKGKVGYKIVKFQLLPVDANTALENTVKIYKDEQATPSILINLTDDTILAAAIIQQSVSTQGSAYSLVVMDKEIFNQDIYITHKGASAGAGESVNYYLELEVIPLDDAGAEYTTLKDMRST